MFRKLQDRNLMLAVGLAVAALLILPACSVNVKKGEKGEEKKVDIETPMGGVHVNQDVDARDTGLPVYPGARPKPKQQDDDNGANVNLSFGRFGLKVVAIEFVSDDSPDKVAAFYRDKLKAYGNILECHTDNGGPNFSMRAGDKDKDSKELRCDNNSGKNLELKVGTQDNQHLVNIRPQDSGKGTDFALVYVRTHGDKEKDTI